MYESLRTFYRSQMSVKSARFSCRYVRGGDTSYYFGNCSRFVPWHAHVSCLPFYLENTDNILSDEVYSFLHEKK